MGLDIPAPAHLPFPLRTLTVGLRPVPVDAWLEPAGPDELARKVADLDAHPEAVAWLPGSEAAQAELAGVLAAAEPTIGACGRAVVDDLCLLDRASGAGGLDRASGAGGLDRASGAGGPDRASGAGGLDRASGAGGFDRASGAGGLDRAAGADSDRLVLVAGAVAHPNRWRLADKLGLPLLGVHGPVPGYPGRLAGQVERVLRSLQPGRALERRSWALLDDPTLHQPVSSAMPTRFDPEGLWLRVERQALRRLPATGAVVFAIRTRQWRVDGLAAYPEQAAGLAASLRSTPDELAAYKGVAGIREALLVWLDQAAGTASS